MCNACGFFCCGSDEFDGCGCDQCPESECWGPDDNDLTDPLANEEWDGGPDLLAACCHPRPKSFVCEAVT